MHYQENYSLSSLNTFNLNVQTRFYIKVHSVAELQSVLADKHFFSLPKLILGGGSNLLFTQDFRGLVIHIALQGIEVVKETPDHIYLKIGAGELWHKSVLYCLEHQYAGIENLSLIPGTVGAAPIQNIGAYGVELKDVFESLEAICLSDGKVHLFQGDDCQFSYRESIFKTQYKNQFIITAVTLRLDKVPQFKTTYGDIQATLQEMGIKKLSLKAVSDAIITIRQSKLPDPKILGNAGSFFKNPQIDIKQFVDLQKNYPTIPSFPAPSGSQADKIKIPAAWLIEQCGWKGVRRDNIGVHAKQALVLVNYGNGLGQDILQLAEDIRESVINKFKINLEMEVMVC